MTYRTVAYWTARKAFYTVLIAQFPKADVNGTLTAKESYCQTMIDLY